MTTKTSWIVALALGAFAMGCSAESADANDDPSLEESSEAVTSNVVTVGGCSFTLSTPGLVTTVTRSAAVAGKCTSKVFKLGVASHGGATPTLVASGTGVVVATGVRGPQELDWPSLAMYAISATDDKPTRETHLAVTNFEFKAVGSGGVGLHSATISNKAGTITVRGTGMVQDGPFAYTAQYAAFTGGAVAPVVVAKPTTLSAASTTQSQNWILTRGCKYTTGQTPETSSSGPIATVTRTALDAGACDAGTLKLQEGAAGKLVASGTGAVVAYQGWIGAVQLAAIPSKGAVTKSTALGVNAFGRYVGGSVNLATLTDNAGTITLTGGGGGTLNGRVSEYFTYTARYDAFGLAGPVKAPVLVRKPAQ